MFGKNGRMVVWYNLQRRTQQTEQGPSSSCLLLRILKMTGLQCLHDHLDLPTFSH